MPKDKFLQSASALTCGANPSEPIGYVAEDTVAQMVGVSVRTVQRWRSTGDGPKFTRVGLRRVVYNPEEVRIWAKSRTFAHHAEELSKDKSEAA